MKKIAKLSLVAAVAVAGFTTSSMATSLEESIKNVDVSGQFRYRFQDKSTGSENSDVEVEIGLKVPVTENITAVFKIDNADNHTESDGSTKNDVELEDYYFSYANSGTTVNVGQQNVPGRLTDAPQGDGVVALQQVGSFTVGAAAFINNSVTDSNNLYSAIAMGNMGPVSLSAQYVDLVEHSTAYTVKADASLGVAKIGAEYADRELENGTDDLSTAKAYVSAKLGMLSALVSYTKTGDNGSGAVDGELEAGVETFLWNVGSAGRADADMIVVDASLAVTDKVSLRAAILSGEQGNSMNNELQEIVGQVSYKVAKNLSTLVRYADVEEMGAEYTRARAEIKYSF